MTGRENVYFLDKSGNITISKNWVSSTSLIVDQNGRPSEKADAIAFFVNTDYLKK